MLLQHCTCAQQGVNGSADGVTRYSQKVVWEHGGARPEMPMCRRINKETGGEGGGHGGRSCLKGVHVAEQPIV